jgi:hypothetical protein
MQDKSPSMYGRNVKIITKDGMVTLRGPVRLDEEKQAVDSKAKEVAGDEKVRDELKVTGRESPKSEIEKENSNMSKNTAVFGIYPSYSSVESGVDA